MVTSRTERERASAEGASTDRLARAVLWAFGLYGIGLSLLMIVSPGTFYEQVGPFGIRNDHYIRDAATFQLALGVGAVLAVGRPRWRFPVLAITTFQYATHALNHLADIGEADPAWLGPAEFVGLAVGAVLLAWTTRKVAGAERELSP